MIVLNDLLDYKGYKIYQDTDMFCFSLDSILLANFVTINKNINSIMDIGCGNGPIPLVLSTKTNARITGVEIQKDVYNLAIDSVKYNKLENQIKILNADINNLYKDYESDSFDVITCNPPYFKVNDKTKQNISEYKKIARHEITLKLDDICKISKKLLKNNGVLAIVHRPDRMIEILNGEANRFLNKVKVIQISLFIVVIAILILSYFILWKSYEESLALLLEKSFELIKLIPEEIKYIIVSKLNE